ncbi:MAG: hypothetical protein SVX43_06655 [Cyanobacteriota bacterium]|nr:hypothetical protein [Cyanobacteriota bacterium]
MAILTACGTPTPPIGLAPGGAIVQKAIALQLEQSQQQLSEQLQASNPVSNITRVSVKQIEPLYLGKLPTYHLTGTYNLKIDLGDRQKTQKNNEFDIYIQRQKEGKTWRWLKRVTGGSDAVPQWLSYLVR